MNTYNYTTATYLKELLNGLPAQRTYRVVALVIKTRNPLNKLFYKTMQFFINPVLLLTTSSSLDVNGNFRNDLKAMLKIVQVPKEIMSWMNQRDQVGKMLI